MASVYDSSFSIKICRACLSAGEDIKFYEIKEKITYFTEFARLKTDSLEVHWLCHECHYLIGKTMSFRDRVINADFMLKGLQGKYTTEKEMILDYLKAARDVLAMRRLTSSKILTTSYTKEGLNDEEALLCEVPITLEHVKQELIDKSLVSDYDDIVKNEEVDVKDEHFDSNDQCYFDDMDDLPLVSIKRSLKELSKRKVRVPKKKKRIKRESCDDVSLKKMLKMALVVQNNEKVIMISLSKVEQIEALKEQANMKVYAESVYKCELCMKGFRFEDTFKAHLERHNEDYGPYKCDICMQYMKTATSHRNHMLNHSKRYQCTLCDFTRFSRSTVVEHYGAEHLKDCTKMHCNLCGKEFLKPSVMRKHMQYRHGGGDRTKPTCEHCGKSFTAQETLRLHMLKHLGPKPEGRKRYKCLVCEMSFRTPTLLRSHGIKHSNSRDYYCVECDLSFKSEFILKQHLKTSKRHVDPSTLVQCSQCPMKALNQKLLDQHVEKMHLMVADFQCKLCPRAFYTNTLLRKHHRRVHEGFKPPKKHICDICSKGFRTKVTLTSHLRTHTGEKPFECAECEARFTHTGTLHTHVRLVHRKIKRNPKKGRVSPVAP